MTFEEWSTCKEAWWVFPYTIQIVRVRLVGPPEYSERHREMVRRNARNTPWYFFEGARWFATEDEARFYVEVLR